MPALTVMLMRHGHAVDDAPSLGDDGRWLTEKGRDRTRDVARRLAAWRTKPEVIFTSPLVRAVQTAEIVASVLEHRGAISALAELVVNGRPRTVAQMIRGYQGPERALLFVGHEPSLSVLANTLLDAHDWAGFKKSQLLALAVEPSVAGAKILDTIEP
ncbi:MAG: histidine phosphatase family protein [Myxococcales bacterium]|nr:histidine phosphatase family protein [Myxococcales bacterium]